MAILFEKERCVMYILMHWLGSFLTFMAGSIFGVVMMCIMQVAGESDRETEKQNRF